MTTLDFNTKAKNLKGEEQKNTLGEVLADLLASETKGDALKFYGWALSLTSAKAIDVDSSDFKKLYELIENSERIMILVKAQLMEVMDEAKTKHDKPKE